MPSMSPVIGPPPPKPLQDAPVAPFVAAREPFWTPVSSRPGVLTTVLVAGLSWFGAATLIALPGIQWGLLSVGAVFVVLIATRHDPALRSARLTHSDRLLLGVAVGLACVPALRDDFALVLTAIAGCLGLVAIVSHRARMLTQVLSAGVLAVIGSVRGARWFSLGLRQSAHGARPLLRGLGKGVSIGLPGAACVAALLSAADPAYALALQRATGALDATTTMRVVAGSLVAGALIVALHGLAHPVRWWTPRVRPPRPAAEWVAPLVMLDGLIALWVVVQVQRLFAVAARTDLADRARQGFFELLAVILVVAITLAWASGRVSRPDRAQRGILIGLGCLTVLLVLVLVASAITRMVHYTRDYGATVLRLEVVVAEVWLAAVLLGAGVAWLRGRTAGLVRAVVGSAGALVIALGVLGPESLVARWNVERYQRTGSFDVGYARNLSRDAVPELARLPEPLRSCVLPEPMDPGPWYAANVARWRAAESLASTPRSPCPQEPGPATVAR